MPDTTPTTSATGIMTTITQNMRRPVASRAGPSLCTTFTLNLVEQPKSPSSTPDNRRVAGSSHQEKRGVAWPVAASILGSFGQIPSHVA